MAADGSSGPVSESTDPQESGDIEVHPIPEEEAARRTRSPHPEWESGEEELSIKGARGGTRVDTGEQ